MRQSHLILLNASIMWTSRIFLLVPQLILVPYLIGTIGEVGYGVYALVWSLMMSIEQLQKSLQSGVVKYSAGFLAKKQTDEVNRLISSSFVFSLLLAVLVSAGALVSALFYNDPNGQIVMALIVLGIMVLFIFPMTPYVAVIQAKQRYYVGAIAETVSKYISLLAIMAWFYMVSPSVEALIIIMAIMLFLSKLVQVPIAYSMVPGLRNRLSLFNNKSFRLITAFGFATVLASIFLAINSTGIRWLMNSLVSASFVTQLVIMLMPGLLLTQIIGAVAIVVMPATSAYKATENEQMLQELLIRGMRYTLIIGLAGVLVASLLMENVITLWVGTEYKFLAPYALALFASISFKSSTSIAHHMLKGLGKLKTVILIYFFSLAAIPIALILIIFKIWNDPYIAVTLGLVVGNLVCGALQIWFTTKAVRANIWNVLLRSFAQPMIVALVIFGTLLAFLAYAGIDGIFGRLSVSVLVSLLFIGGCYIFIFTSAEQQQVKEMVQSIKTKFLNAKGVK